MLNFLTAVYIFILYYFQVLPERTHPEVTMNSASGFLLTGYVLK